MKCEYFTPKWLILELFNLAWYHTIHSLYIYLGYELPLYKIYTNISTNMDTTNIFPFLAIFAHNFYYFSKKLLILGPILLLIIA